MIPKISITFDKGMQLIKKFLNDNRFRNRSHVIEHSLGRLLEVEFKGRKIK